MTIEELNEIEMVNLDLACTSAILEESKVIKL